MAWKTIEHSYNLSRHLIPFMSDTAFYAEISKNVQKRYTLDIPTCAVTYDSKADEVVMWVNPVFMGGGEYTAPNGQKVIEAGLTNWQTRGVITHEFDHLVFGHLNARRPDDAERGMDWNIATDLAINSMIIQRSVARPRGYDDDREDGPLPKLALVPGQRPFVNPAHVENLSPERKKALEHFSDLIAKFPTGKASEWYYNKLLEDRNKNPQMYPQDQGVGVVIGSMDDHSGWDDISDEEREYAQAKIRGIIEKAVKQADSVAEGWGSIPAELREEIRRSLSTIVNWRAVLRQFVGTLVRGQRTTSIKRINKRYPYIHPGTKRGYVAKLLVAIDESGSVSDEMLEMFFAELEQLTRRVDVTILHFDCYCDVKDLYEWKRGTRPKLSRVKGGGTDFNAPTNLVNDPKNRGRWDGLLIATDGCAPQPGPSRLKRGWILGQGCKLMFNTNETQIFLTKETPVKGAWR